MPAGRPTSYKAEYPEQANKYCLLGATNVQLAEMFNVSVSSIDKWIKDIPEFSSAIKQGREIADAKVAASLYHRALGYSHPEEKIFCQNGEITVAQTIKHYPPDATSAIFWLKNRQRDQWREVTNIEGKLTHDHTHRIEVVQAETQSILDGFAEIGADPVPALPVSDEPVLPDKGSLPAH